ncbi:hypothetical protein QR680_003466 [Steinernema hermaphroditum]|uniref:CNNM transmembrane domain-containing protein n=1 Tax=Steinernema hermaphroditum TaxID=289476 RepID=A0AA39H6Y0_9BILA|nr:hypothetical protein QR680_003466 [Steinernema hermaphroditum]
MRDDDELSFGYDPIGVCIISPDVPIKVVVYGNRLEHVAQLIFTSTENCSDPARTINAENDFKVHFEHRAVFDLSLPALPENVHVYKMCVKQKTPTNDGILLPIDDARTWFTTEHPPRQHYLPLPIQIGVIAFFLVLSALFSGLTLGLMSLTPMELELVQKSGSQKEQKYAATILPIRRKGNLLLCSLLLGNVIVNSAISILFGDLTSGFLALFISSAGIVIFGEIVPQSICVKKGLAVGAYTIGVTKFFIFLTFPVAWPISKLLDCLLGDEYVAYDRKRLMELIKLNTVNQDGQLAEEFKIAVGAMELYDKVGKDVMTRIEDVFMLPNNTILNAKTVAEIVRTGYTRIPVYMTGDKNCITDILFVKDLALLDPDDNFTVKTVCGYHQHPVKFVLEDTPLKVMLEEFKKRDLTKFFEKEVPDASVSMQIQIVAVQWLVANEPAFSEQYIDRNVLERLVRTNCKKIDISALKALTGKDFPVLPKTAKLFTKGEISDRFILILEGRAVVTIGQDEMKFDAGPWHSFGNEVLRKMTQNYSTLSRSMSVADGKDFSARRPDLAFVPDYSVIIKDDCTYLEVTASSYVNAYRATLMQREMGKGDLHSSNTSLNGLQEEMHISKQSPAHKFPPNTRSPIRRIQEEAPVIPRLYANLSEARAAVKALNRIERDRREELEDMKDEEQINLLRTKIEEEHDEKF